MEAFQINAILDPNKANVTDIGLVLGDNKRNIQFGFQEIIDQAKGNTTQNLNKTTYNLSFTPRMNKVNYQLSYTHVSPSFKLSVSVATAVHYFETTF